MVLLVSREYRGPMTPIYVVTDISDEDLVEYWTEDEKKRVFRKEFRTVRGLSRFLKHYFRAEK